MKNNNSIVNEKDWDQINNYDKEQKKIKDEENKKLEEKYKKIYYNDMKNFNNKNISRAFYLFFACMLFYFFSMSMLIY